MVEGLGGLRGNLAKREHGDLENLSQGQGESLNVHKGADEDRATANHLGANGAKSKAEEDQRRGGED